ncbi:MAG TPA: PDZ domain-containing protein [Gemmatimonadaceae bacterium]|nr:PDZ domain-containing protein [Gemmatimonadaceae bacterium]
MLLFLAHLFALTAPQPSIHYTLRVDPSDLTAFSVEMRIRNAPDSFRVAFAAHPEYDDKYWRYIEGLSVTAPAGAATITRADSVVWRVVARGGEAVLRYRIKLPPGESPRAAWQPFLTPTGALVGGPHSFMYVLGGERWSSHVTLDIPRDWKVATELLPTSESRTYFAQTADALMEGPFLVGTYSDWSFTVDGVPHRVVYWRAPNATAFDTTRFVRGVEGIVRQAVSVFGRPPWREYTFMYQDNAYGGLEHPASVTLGAPSQALAQDQGEYLHETAHEFFHAWNLMRIRPIEYRLIDYRLQPPTSGLWFSEGLTILYADLLMRRAGLTTFEPTREAHMENIITRYHAQPGNYRHSAVRTSQLSYNTDLEGFGDYIASAHLQGEVIGAMLDLIVRNATDGRRTIDDVMRRMYERFDGAAVGFTSRDVERVVEDVCACDVTPLFDAHVLNATAPINFDRYLALIGYRAVITQTPALNRDGTPSVDLRLWAGVRESDGSLRLRISNGESAWGRAGLHTGDKIFAVNGSAVRTWPEFRAHIARLRIGDTVRVEVERPTGKVTATVVQAGFTQPVVRLEPVANATPKAVRLREAWAAGR